MCTDYRALMLCFSSVMVHDTVPIPFFRVTDSSGYFHIQNYPMQLLLHLSRHGGTSSLKLAQPGQPGSQASLAWLALLELQVPPHSAQPVPLAQTQ